MTTTKASFKVPSDGWVSFKALVNEEQKLRNLPKNAKIHRVRFPIGSILEVEVPFEEYVFNSKTGEQEYEKTALSYYLVGNGGPVGVLVDCGLLTEGEGQISYLRYPSILRWNPFISTEKVEIEFV